MVAQIQPVDLVAPGFLGLNFSQASNLLSPQFATRAQNAVIDNAGRLAARSGFSDLTTTDIGGNPAIRSIWERRTGTGGTQTILSWDGGISNSVTNPAGSDISGAVTDADGRWWFQNFNELTIGFQDGLGPISYNGTGSFATIVASSGTLPTSHRGIGLCAFGRVWMLDSDGQTIRYSALLDETAWGGADSGSIDMSSVWSDGMDEVTAIVAFNGQLVVFGNRHIVFWLDGKGAALGLNPTDIYVNDQVTGTGCLTQWSIQAVGESDLVYVSANGVQSIKRVINAAANPLTDLSKKVRNNLVTTLQNVTDFDTLRSVYSPLHGFYLLTIPDQAAPQITGITYCLDQRFKYQDEAGDALSIVTTWTLAPTAWHFFDNFQLLLGGTYGVGLYGGATTDNGSTFRFIYQSPWLDLGEDFADRLKILKRIGAILFVKNNTSIIFKWSVDFDDTFKTIVRSVNSDSAAEWGVGEWGVMEWSGGLTLRIIKVPARDTGQYFRLGIEADVNGEFALQQLELFTKIGRLA